jgi:hypothetical protein
LASGTSSPSASKHGTGAFEEQGTFSCIPAFHGHTPQQAAQWRPSFAVKQELHVPQAELLAQVSAGSWQANPL